MEEAFDVFHEMTISGVEADVMIYSAMCAVCAKCGRGDQALALYREMKQSNIKPDTILYNILISACEKVSVRTRI